MNSLVISLITPIPKSFR